MFNSHETFATECTAQFAGLVSLFGFSPPLTESIGRECFVRYNKGERTVSIAWEPGGTPIVELFFPAGPNDESVPWAARDSVPYARRFPSLKPDGVTPERGGKQLSLAEIARALVENEKEFLARAA